MNPLSPSPDDARRADLSAAAWLIKHDRGFTPAEQDEFFQWLAADPRNGEEFARHRETWRELNGLAEWRPEHSAEPNPDLLARPKPARPDNVQRVWFGALAAAACIALALLWSRPWENTGPAPTVNIAAKGYERRVLEDGSVIELKRGARVEVAYSATERRVRLAEGEANFTVAKNPERPFIVRAGDVDVRAVGTEFNVRLGQTHVEVLVTEGRVRVDDAVRGQSLIAAVASDEPPVLAAGQKVVVEAVPTTPTPVPVVAATVAEIDRAVAWRPQMLDFESAPLIEVVEAFNRHNDIHVVIADASVRDIPIVASFRSDNIEGFVRLLELHDGVRVEQHGDTITLRAAQ